MKSRILAVSSLAALLAASVAMAQEGPVPPDGPEPAAPPPPTALPVDAQKSAEPPARPETGGRPGVIGALLRHARAFVDAVLSDDAADGALDAAGPAGLLADPAPGQGVMPPPAPLPAAADDDQARGTAAPVRLPDFTPHRTHAP